MSHATSSPPVNKKRSRSSLAVNPDVVDDSVIKSVRLDQDPVSFGGDNLAADPNDVEMSYIPVSSGPMLPGPVPPSPIPLPMPPGPMPPGPMLPGAVPIGAVSSGPIPDDRRIPSERHGNLVVGVSVSESGLIDRIGTVGRTDSPFGGRMGDHTVSWQSVTDSVRASLHGKSLPDAVPALEQMHAYAAGWMNQGSSSTGELLGMLDDRDERNKALGEANQDTIAWLRAARDAAANNNSDDASAKLAKAISSHLQYVNYLPFATVPAAADRGSTGGVEGTARGKLIAYEVDKSLPGNGLRENLREQFDWPAALRESHIELALDPSIAGEATEHSQNLKELAERINEPRIQSEGRTSRSNPSVQVGDAISTALGEIGENAFRKVRRAGLLPKQAGDDIARSASKMKGLRKEYLDKILERKKKNNKDDEKRMNDARGHAEAAEDAAKQLADMDEGASKRADLVLLHLLREHGRVVATDYPGSVEATGYLAGPADVEEELRQAAQKQYPDLLKGEDAQQNLDKLKAIAEKYQRVEPIVEPGGSWAENARNEPLLAAYDESKGTFDISGRPRAPKGVQGMGSHTTAWLVEEDALNGLVAGAANPAEAHGRIREAVKRDLKSGVMELDALLPGHQLEAGQLIDLFEAADNVMQTDDINKAAQYYLQFRNLLPFATVNEGDRGGHGESRSATLEESFDTDALTQAAESQKDVLKDNGQRGALINSLRGAVDSLQNTYVAKTDHVREAASDSARRLESMAKRISDAQGKPLDLQELQEKVPERIENVRRQEHEEHYRRATEFRKLSGGKTSSAQARMEDLPGRRDARCPLAMPGSRDRGRCVMLC
jgi:hypothetical protein